VIAYCATLDVPRELVRFAAKFPTWRDGRAAKHGHTLKSATAASSTDRSRLRNIEAKLGR
jgi:hypothetical protein